MTELYTTKGYRRAVLDVYIDSRWGARLYAEGEG